MASIGLLGFPFMPLLLWAIIVFGGAAALHVRRGGSIERPRQCVARRFGRDWTAPWSRRTRRLLILFFAPLVILPGLLRSWDPLSAGGAIAPGPAAEVRQDGVWQDDVVENAVEWGGGPDDPCLDQCPGPRFVYRVRPGEPYWWLTTVRNDGPLPVRLLGRDPVSAKAGWGLALLLDPSRLSADASNLRPFEEVFLWPGAAVTVALAQVADSCADPAADVPAWDPNSIAPPNYFVYQVLGWNRVGNIWPHFAVTVAGCTWSLE